MKTKKQELDGLRKEIAQLETAIEEARQNGLNQKLIYGMEVALQILIDEYVATI